MKQRIYNALVSTPGWIISHAIPVVGIVAGLYPETARKLVASITVEQARLSAAAGVVFLLAYWVLRLALRPSPNPNEPSQVPRTYGDQSPAFVGTFHGPVTNISNGAPRFRFSEEWKGKLEQRLMNLQIDEQTSIIVVGDGFSTDVANSVAVYLQQRGFPHVQRKFKVVWAERERSDTREPIFVRDAGIIKRGSVSNPGRRTIFVFVRVENA